MTRSFAAFIISLFLLGFVGEAQAQFTFSNFLESRVGRSPNSGFDHGDQIFRFDQFNLDYFHDNLRLGLRFESYVPSSDPTLEFNEFTHRYAEWTGERMDARVGNFNALFGRGVVLRAFELSGTIREEGGQIFGDSRDLDGVSLRYHAPRLEIIVLSGKPRLADNPPGNLRSKTVSGAMATVRVARGVKLGGEFVRIDSPTTVPSATLTAEIPGGFLQIDWDSYLRDLGQKNISVSTYVEYARATGLNISPFISSNKVDPNEGRALYFSQTLFVRDLLPRFRMGLSWEYKDYQNFDFLVNEPPQLVREHSYALLNRNTHVVEARQENGYQFESRFHYAKAAELVLNWSRAENQDSERFKEFFAEVTGHYGGSKMSLFAGNSQDATKALFDRHTFGIYGLFPILKQHSLEAEYEQMTAHRQLGGSEFAFKDNYVSLTYALATRFSVTAIRQTTNDVEAQDRTTGEIDRKEFDSISFSIPIKDHHELLGFWGRRRSGLQCTAGTCYNLPEFDGVTLSLLSRF